jgi:hypothetical protein
LTVGLLRTHLFWLAAALGLSVLMVGCASGFSQLKTPVWVLDPPADTPLELWGVGEGPDLEVARRAALRAVAARLRVSISGSVDRSVSLANQSVYTTEQSRVREEVGETEFVGVSIDRTARHANGVHVLLRIDRRAFLQDTRDRFRAAQQRVQRGLTGLDAQAPLEQVRSLRSVLNEVETGLRLGKLLRTLEASEADQTAIVQLEHTRSLVLLAPGRLKFSLEHNARDAKVASELAEFLASQGLKSVSGERGLVLRIKVDTREEILFDNWTCQLQIGLEWLDERGQLIARRQHQVSGLSLANLQQACQEAVSRFGRLIRTTGLQAGLGLPL